MSLASAELPASATPAAPKSSLSGLHNVAEGQKTYYQKQDIDFAELMHALEQEVCSTSYTSAKTEVPVIPIPNEEKEPKEKRKNCRAKKRKATTFCRLSEPQRRQRIFDAFLKNAPAKLYAVCFHIPDDLVHRSTKTVTGVALEQLQRLLEEIQRQTGKRPAYIAVVEFVDDESKIGKISINEGIGCHVHALIELPPKAKKVFVDWAIIFCQKYMPNRNHAEDTIRIPKSSTPVFYRRVYGLPGALNYMKKALGRFMKRAKELGFEIDRRHPLRPLATSDHIRKIAEDNFKKEPHPILT